MRRQLFLLLGLMALLAIGGQCSFAQSTSTLSGAVRDASGAVVPGASVRVKNQASGDERKTVTTREGVYSVPALRAGTYQITATAKGFGAFVVTDIVLNAQDNKSVDITLQLETVNASITVSAQIDSSIVEEDTGAKGETISGDDLQNMTMATRNAAEIVKLMSGASLAANGGVNSFSTTNLVGMNTWTASGTAAGLGGTYINGQSVDLTMDGSHNFDPGSPGQNTPINPNMDMISELKVLSSSFSAEYEHGPVVVNVETKGGGQKYHGQVHLYAQNSALNAVDTDIKKNNSPILDTYQYYPGAQLSGPLPSIGGFNKLKNKLFFFDGFEAYRQLLAPGIMRAVVPTDAMLAGDFSPESNPDLRSVGNLNPYYDTSGNLTNVPVFSSNKSYSDYRSGCVITGGVMNSSCISSAGQNLMSAYFANARPNVDPATHEGWNFEQQVTTQMNQWQNVARVDLSISDNTKLYVRVNTSRESANNPMGVWSSSTGNEIVPAPTVAVANNTADSIAGSLTHVFSPTLTSETTISWGKVKMPNKPQDPSKVSRSAIGLPSTVFGEDLTPSLSNWTSNFPALGPGGYYGGDPLQMKADKLMPSGKEGVTKVLGAHTLKAGGYFEYILNEQDNYGSYGGFLQVPQGWGQDTGNAYATMLMGIVGNEYDEDQRPPMIGNAARQLRFYVTDHWKINRRLTVDLGMRFDHMGKPYTTTNEGLAVWNESLYNNSSSALDYHTGVSWHGMDATIPKSGVKSRLLFYSPRFGLAYDLSGKGTTIVRGGIGLFYAYDKIVNDQYTKAEATAVGAISIACASSNCPTYEMLDPNNNSYLAQYTGHTLPAGIASGLQSISTIDPKEDDSPYVTTYNLQLDQKLPWKFMLEASYVGNYGDGNQYMADINAIKLGRVSVDEYLTCTNNNNCDWNAGSDSSGVYWRPRINYTSINESIVAGKTQYDALQISAHRSSGILFLLSNFTWSKAYSNAAVANGGSYSSLADRGVSEYWGVSPNNRKYTFNVAYTLSEPKINVGNYALRQVVNGWQLSGVTQYSSGANLISNTGGGINFGYSYGDDQVQTTEEDGTTVDTVTTGTHGTYALIGANQATIFPTLTCNPNVHQRVSGGVRFLNPDCFTTTSSGLGNSHPGYFPGPAFVNSDLALMKTVNITERQNLQFKFQAFNFLNHPLWSFNAKDTNLVLNFNGQTIKDGEITQTGGVLADSSSDFGIATWRTGHRTMQLEVRYWF